MGEALFDLGKTGSDKIRDNSSGKNLERLFDMYEEQYRPDFKENHDQKIPSHPWNVFKELRKEIRETHEGQEKHERVYVAEELFEEYKSKWEEYRANFDPEEVETIDDEDF